MKEYPSIQKEIINLPIYAFDKLDGSNIRAEWSPKKGFYKFGSRSRLIDPNDPILGLSIELIKTKYEKDLSDIFKKQGYLSSLCFFEFHGPHSCFGKHNPFETKDVTLFDVNPFKKGILLPQEYLKIFGHLDVAKLLYQGYPDDDFIQLVKNGTLPGMTFEGIIAKAANTKKTPIPIMFKLKNDAWIEKLKEYCKGDLTLFKKLV